MASWTPMLSSSTHSPSENDHLPVEAFYVNGDFRPSVGQDLEMSWSSGPSLTIESKYKTSSFRKYIPRAACKSVKWSKPNDRKNYPVVQIAANNELVTVKFDVENSTWSSIRYRQLVDTFHHLRPLKTSAEVLWEEAQQVALNSRSGASLKEHEVKISQKMEKHKDMQERENRNESSLHDPRKRKEPGSPTTNISKLVEEDSDKWMLSTASKRRNIDNPADSSSFCCLAEDSAPEKPVLASDVILVYGAINITNADLARLGPEEFLNDTLIEFGLKFWLKNLELKNPELANQIHIFNSFFYKKLSQKDPQQAHANVKKWTSKIDIFKKKYVIVPINEDLHWYLAIIYEPEHILFPVHEAPPVQKEARASKKADVAARQVQETILEPLDMTENQNSTPTETGIKRNLYDEFQKSCTIKNLGSCDEDEGLLHSKPTDASDDCSKSSARLCYVSREGDEVTSAQSSFCPLTLTTSLDRTESAHPTISKTEKVSDSAEESESLNLKPSIGIAPSFCYGKRTSDVRVEEIKPVEDVVAEERPKTYIFTMDSLGIRHPHAIKRLAEYLKMEARDKKGVEDGSLATGKFASVPIQPNFCDCGVYLLHFAQTFMAKPQDYCHRILTQRSKSVTEEERQYAWKQAEVEQLREKMLSNIQKLSAEWKKARAADIEAKQAEQPEGEADGTTADSDTEVEVIAMVGLTKPGKSTHRE